MAIKKWVCTVCGYVYEGKNVPEKCSQCGVPASKLKEQVSGGMAWICGYEIGVAQDSPEGIMMDLRANFEDEYSEVDIYLAISRVAHREGYPEIGTCWAKAAFEGAERAAKFAGLLGEAATSSTGKSLEMRVTAENGATADKFDLAKGAKALNLDAIHDTVHKMAKDEVRHGKAFEGPLNRYFG